MFDEEADGLSACLDVPIVKHLIKYWGHNNVHRGKNSEMHKALLQHVGNRVEGWKIKCLFRAVS